MESIDGYLEVFKDEGNHWSLYILDIIIMFFIQLKKRVSNLCSNGLYYFKSINLYKKTFVEIENEKQELFIAPMYNSLIKKYNIKYIEINKKIFFLWNTWRVWNFKRIRILKSYSNLFSSKNLTIIEQIVNSGVNFFITIYFYKNLPFSSLGLWTFLILFLYYQLLLIISWNLFIAKFNTQLDKDKKYVEILYTSSFFISSIIGLISVLIIL